MIDSDEVFERADNNVSKILEKEERKDFVPCYSIKNEKELVEEDYDFLEMLYSDPLPEYNDEELMNRKMEK